MKQNKKTNLILFPLFTGSVQLNQEWEAWMGSVSMLDISFLIMWFFSYCLSLSLEVILESYVYITSSYFMSVVLSVLYESWVNPKNFVTVGGSSVY